MGVSWNGGYPQIIHLWVVFLHEINHPFWGYPHDYGNPHRFPLLRCRLKLLHGLHHRWEATGLVDILHPLGFRAPVAQHSNAWEKIGDQLGSKAGQLGSDTARWDNQFWNGEAWWNLMWHGETTWKDCDDARIHQTCKPCKHKGPWQNAKIRPRMSISSFPVTSPSNPHPAPSHPFWLWGVKTLPQNMYRYV